MKKDDTKYLFFEETNLTCGQQGNEAVSFVLKTDKNYASGDIFIKTECHGVHAMELQIFCVPIKRVRELAEKLIKFADHLDSIKEN